jgi:hypothetical protein
MAPKRKAAKKAKSATRTTAKRATRSAAILKVPATEGDVHKMLDILRDKEVPIKDRLAALQSVQAATFSMAGFDSVRADFIAALRQVADDPDHELRQRVLGILMREKDGYAQKKLLDGLKAPDKALLPPEKALQLLSYDVHADAYKIARNIISKPPNDRAKREALRLLAADAKAAPLFEKVLRDKKELRENRQIAASALHALTPERLARHARAILLDKSDYDDIKATSLTALTQFGHAAIGKDKTLLDRVDRLKAGASAKVKQSARRFLTKFGR